MFDLMFNIQGSVVQKLMASLVTIREKFKHEYYKYTVIFCR